MITLVKTILTGQFEASLCMLKECIQKCPQEHWEDKIANDTFRQVAYHTLFWTDLYLSANEAAFQLRDVHQRGGDDRSDSGPSVGLDRDEALGYVAFCRAKGLEVLTAETAESLQGPSGFSWLALPRAELHLYNIRHIQHHTGQLSAFLRRIVHDGERWWVKTGWR
jgi:hypothetical protein